MTAPQPPGDDGFSLRQVALAGFGPSLLYGMAEGAVMPVLPIVARQLGATPSQAALVVALVGIGALLNNVPASLITHHRGERWAIVAAAGWAALAFVLCALTPVLPLLAVACAMLGMAQSVFNLARQSYLADAVPLAWRARAMATLGGVMRIGMFVGPFAGAAAIQLFGLRAACAVSVGAMAGAALLAARMPHGVPHADAAEPSNKPRWADTLRGHRRVLLTLGLGVMLVSAVRASRQVVIPLWADHLGLEASAAALIYGLAGGIDMLVFYPAGRWMDRHGRRAVAVPSMLIMGTALLLMPFTAGSASLLLASLALGFGNGIGSGLIMTLGADHAPRQGRAAFLGLWRLMSDLGASSGPALLSAASAALSLAAGVALAGALALGAAVQLGWWIPRIGGHRDDV